MAHAARLLRMVAPPRRFDVELDEAADGLTVRFEGENVDRADIYTDGRPRTSVNLTDGTTSAAVPGAGAPGEVRVEGFAAGQPVAVRIFRRDQQGRLIPLSAFLQ